MSIRIVLADDHGITRQGLHSLLENEPDFEVIGEAEDGREAIDLVRKLQPDILLTDISMPNLNGIDATRQVVHEFPETKIIALSIHSNKAFITDMLRAGASGYVLKECLFEEVIEAVTTVMAGGKYLSKKVAGVVVTEYIKNLSSEPQSPLESLTTREREVLQLVAEGNTTKQIALALHVSVKAIEAHRHKIMSKLGARSIADLVKIAISGGLTSIES
jgi:two-component system response regulator NreC